MVIPLSFIIIIIIIIINYLIKNNKFTLFLYIL